MSSKQPIVKRLRMRFFSISREPRTSRSHVTSALARGLQFEFTFEVHFLAVSDLPQGYFFFSLKHHNATFERNTTFKNYFAY